MLPFANSRLSILSSSGSEFVPTLANRILDLLTLLAFPLAVVGILYTAYLLINSAGKPDVFATVKKNLSYLLIGFTLIIGAAIFVGAFLQFFSGLGGSR